MEDYICAILIALSNLLTALWAAIKIRLLVARMYGFNILIVLDNTLNALLGGNPCEVISARCYREKRYRLIAIIDFIFFWEPNHCEKSYHWLKSRKNLPPEYYTSDNNP